MQFGEKSQQIILTLKKHVDLKLLQMNFLNNSVLLKDIKLFPVNNLTQKPQIPEFTTATT